jgi:hypothetical protein
VLGREDWFYLWALILGGYLYEPKLTSTTISKKQYFNVNNFSRKLVLFLCLFMFSVCSSRKESTETGSMQDVIVHRTLSPQAQYMERDESNGNSSMIGVGFVRPEDRNTLPGQLSQNDELRVAENEPLSLDLILISGEDATFLVTV